MKATLRAPLFAAVVKAYERRFPRAAHKSRKPGIVGVAAYLRSKPGKKR